MLLVVTATALALVGCGGSETTGDDGIPPSGHAGFSHDEARQVASEIARRISTEIASRFQFSSKPRVTLEGVVKDFNSAGHGAWMAEYSATRPVAFPDQLWTSTGFSRVCAAFWEVPRGGGEYRYEWGAC